MKGSLMKVIITQSFILLSFIVTLFAFLFSGTACLPDAYGVGQPDSLFSEFVLVRDMVDQYYACFCQNIADWDQVYAIYRPLAMNLADRDQLIELTLDMLGELRDVQLVIADSSGTIMESWNPGDFVNWDMEVWLSYMEEWGCPLEMDPFGITPLAPPFDSIGYIYISSLDNTYDWAGFFGASFAIQHCSSLIFDLRMCQGSGIETNAIYTMGRFTSISTLAYYKSYREGPGRCDMGELQPVYSTRNGAWQFTRPVLVLTGRETQGAAELLTLLLATQDHVTVIGDTTYGYSNVSLTYNLLDDWTIYIPFMMAYMPDSTALFGNEIVPEIYVRTTEADFQAGIDPVLDAALEMLL